MLIFPGVASNAAMEIAYRIRDSIVEKPFDLPKGPIAVTANLGVTTFTGNEPVDKETLIAKVDTALSTAKLAGRNRCFSA